MRDSEQILRQIYAAVVASGIDLGEVDRRLEFSCVQMSDPSRRSRHAWQVNFWRAIEEVSGDPDIGIHLCPNLPRFENSVIEYLFLSCRTFGQACRLALRYERLISDAYHAALDIEGDEAVARISGTNGSDSALRHGEVCFVYGTVAFLRHMSRGAFEPRLVRLCCRPHHAIEDYARIFGCPVEFVEGCSQIRFDRAMLAIESEYQDERMVDVHCQHADRELAGLERQDLIDALRRAILRRMPGADGQDIDVEHLARDVDLPARRIRAELAEVGTSPRKLISSLRFNTACRLLEKSRGTADEIADLLGYASTRAFRRAFKLSTGITPQAYRERTQPQLADRHEPLELMMHMLDQDS